MTILFYTPTSDESGRRLQTALEAVVSKEKIEIHYNDKILSRRLRRPMHGVAIAILLATTKKELLEIYSLKYLFEGIRIILILPDVESDTIALGHKLYPRFISDAHGNFKDVAAVLEKMIGNIYMSQDSNRDQKKHIELQQDILW